MYVSKAHCKYKIMLTDSEMCVKIELVHKSSFTCNINIFLYAVLNILRYITRVTLFNSAAKIMIASLSLDFQLRFTARLYVKCKINFHAFSSQKLLSNIRLLKIKAHADIMTCRRNSNIVIFTIAASIFKSISRFDVWFRIKAYVKC